MKRLFQFVTLLPGLCIFHVVEAAQVQTGIDPEAQLPYWELHDAQMSLRLVQRLPDQTRAFFQARGFSNDNADLIAQSCVFQTVFKNISNRNSPSSLEYNLQDWTVMHAGESRKMKLREDWRREWDRRKIPTAAQLAFEWALYPTWQVYQPGDYNWGMSVFDLKPGRVFDLQVVWRQAGRQHSARIEKIKCAEDVYIAPRGNE